MHSRTWVICQEPALSKGRAFCLFKCSFAVKAELCPLYCLFIDMKLVLQELVGLRERLEQVSTLNGNGLGVQE